MPSNSEIIAFQLRLNQIELGPKINPHKRQKTNL